jgi:hypothetical protein
MSSKEHEGARNVEAAIVLRLSAERGRVVW